MFLFISILAFTALLMMLAYRYRAAIIPHLPSGLWTLFHTTTQYAPLSTFSAQLDAGLSSPLFDIEANIRDGDSRAGLDESSIQEIMDIMRKERVNFDQARLIRQNQILARNGIDPSGIPLDSKAVTRL